MHVKTRTDSKPLLDLPMFMGTLVVYNKVDVKKIRHVCFNMFKKSEELLVTMTLFTFRQNLPGCHIKHCK